MERVDIKNVRLPSHLQRAMAAEAHATREARKKLVDANGEQKASIKLVEAANVMNENPTSMQLRYLHSLSAITNTNSKTVILPFPNELLQINQTIDSLL